MTTTETFTETHHVLAEMLTENTGRHFLDSGSAYGRNWERNQGLTTADFMAMPEAAWGYDADYVVLSVFHFLRERVEFDAELQADFDAFTEAREDSREPWESVLEAYFEERLPGSNVVSGYTYNHDNSLSQDIVWYEAEDDEGEMILVLRIHGGCDARGGFTAPKFFRAAPDWLYGCNDFELCCDGQAPPQTETLPGFPDAETTYHSWSYHGGDYIDRDGSPCDMPELSMNDDGIVPCPECGAPLRPLAPYYDGGW